MHIEERTGLPDSDDYAHAEAAHTDSVQHANRANAEIA